MCASHLSRPIEAAHRGTRSGVRSLRLSLVLFSLAGNGCLRFGYHERVDAGDALREAGTDNAGSAPGAGSAGAGGPSDGGSDAAADGGTTDAARQESDAATSDAGSDSGSQLPGDAGMDTDDADSGPPVVYPLCPERPGVIFCDGFEDPAFTRWAYTVSNNGAVARSTTRAHAGTTSLLATTGPPAQGTEARWATEALASQKSGDAWMRFYNWVPSSVTVTKHFSVGIISESKPPYDGFEVRILPAVVDINTSAGVYQGAMAFPRDRWVCVEMHVLIDPSAGVYEAYLDGVLAARSPPSNTLPADGFTAAEVGVHYADPAQGTVQVYVDDVAVGTSRIPCD